MHKCCIVYYWICDWHYQYLASVSLINWYKMLVIGMDRRQLLHFPARWLPVYISSVIYNYINWIISLHISFVLVVLPKVYEYTISIVQFYMLFDVFDVFEISLHEHDQIESNPSKWELVLHGRVFQLYISTPRSQLDLFGF